VVLGMLVPSRKRAVLTTGDLLRATDRRRMKARTAKTAAILTDSSEFLARRHLRKSAHRPENSQEGIRLFTMRAARAGTESIRAVSPI
jgi:hypothetical protein